MKNLSLIFLIFSLSISCATRRSQSVTGEAAQGEKLLYEAAIKTQKEDKNEESLKAYNQLLKEYPTTRWLIFSLYQRGLLLEKLERWSEAIESYQKILDHYRGTHSQDEAAALYRLAFCYEVLNDNSKLILTLIALDQHPIFSKTEQAQMEIPGRLASAYAREGSREQAKVYLQRAEAGLKKYRKLRLSADILTWLPKALYNMGKPVAFSFKTEQDFQNSIESLRSSQIWLLRAVELNQKPWAELAAQELSQSYDEVMDELKVFKASHSNDAILAEQETQKIRKSLAKMLDENLNVLHKEKVSIEIHTHETHLQGVWNALVQTQKKIDVYISERDIRDGQTPESQKINNPKQKGRLKDL